jgi:hypothetical protein
MKDRSRVELHEYDVAYFFALGCIVSFVTY